MRGERGEHWSRSGGRLVEIVEKAIEAQGMINKDHRLILDESLPIEGPKRVRVIILLGEEEELGEDSTLEIGGKQVTIKDMMNCYRNKMTKKNAADKEAADEKAADEKATKDAEEKKNSDEKTAAEKKAAEDKEAEEKKNADEKAEKEKNEKGEKEELEKKNALEAANKKHFEELRNAANNRHMATADVDCAEDKRARGREMYGSAKSKDGGK